jgi:hypothetical protein
MKSKITFIILLTLGISCFAQLQNPFDKLTKKQMYHDFDQLIQIIQDGNPQLLVRLKVTGLDQMEKMRAMRCQIDTITDNDSFNDLLNHTLEWVMDGHSCETFDVYPEFENLKSIDTAAISARKTYYKSSSYRDKQLRLFPTFWDGAFFYNENYYIRGNHQLFGRKKDTLNITLMKIISVADEEISSFVKNQLLQKCYFDLKNKRFYYGDKWGIYIPDNAKIKAEQNGKEMEFYFNLYPGQMIVQTVPVVLFGVPIKEPLNLRPKYDVSYFPEDRILYISLTTMTEDNDQFYMQIKEVGKSNVIDKVIIDVRDNPGGSDYVWMKMISAIVKDTIHYSTKLAFCDSKIMRKKNNHMKDILTYEKIPFLDNRSYGILNSEMLIIPDTNSIQYDKKIYVLSNRNTFSAGFSLVRFANEVEQVVSVGSPTGQMVGFGLMPELFQLKNSKFSFRLACVMDIYNATKPEDIYQDHTEIEITPTFEEEVLYPRSVYDMKSKPFLYQYDTGFKKVLELK